MIVRCSKCSSAFAVDDTKVENKKFAFSCPRCAHENIIDNTAAKMSVTAETGKRAFIEGDIERGTDTGPGTVPDYDSGAGIREEETGFEEKGVPEDEDFNIEISDDFDFSDTEESIGGDLIIDTPVEDSSGIPESGERAHEALEDLNSDLPDIDLESMIEEEPAFETPGILPEEAVDEDVLDISLDYLEESEKAETVRPPDDIGETPDDFLPIEEEPALDLDRGAEPEGIEIEDEDSITVDIDSLEIEMDEDREEEGGIDFGDISEFDSDSGVPGVADEDESITLDIDSLDIDLQVSDEIVAGDMTEHDMSIPDLVTGDEEVPGLSMEEHPEEDESITLDLEELDLDLVEEEGITEGETPDDTMMELPDSLSLQNVEEEDITLPETEELSVMDIDMPVDEDLSEIQADEIILDEEEDESITLDLEALDLDLVEEEAVKEGEIPDELNIGVSEAATETGRFVMEEPEEDESITIDLNTLDIPLAEDEEVMEGEVADEDESLTLEDAGLTFDELTTEEMASAAGETVDEIEEAIDEDEDIRITIDEIDPDLDIESLESDIEGEAVAGVEKDITGLGPEEGRGNDHYPEVDFGLDEDEISGIDSEIDEIKKSLDESDVDVEYPEVRESSGEVDYDFFSDEDLPDIDFEDTGSEVPAAAGIAAGISKVSDDIIDLEDDREYDSEVSGRKNLFPVSRGNVNFSIDYSLAYSRFGAFLRLTGIFLIGLIPHFIVFLIYMTLSLILGLLNHIIVITTSRPVEDFQGILEKTLRYYLAINASLLGIVEEMPVFTGNDDIDYPLQLNITYSLRSSSLMAILRLSIVGIVLISLPHIIILSLLTIALPFIFLAGTVSVLITRRWPHFLYEFMLIYYNSVARVLAFMMGLVDKYPPFKFG